MKIKCLKCNDIIESLSRHDYRNCKCGTCSIDGGYEYTRIGGDPKQIHIVNDDGTEKTLKINGKNVPKLHLKSGKNVLKLKKLFYYKNSF